MLLMIDEGQSLEIITVIEHKKKKEKEREVEVGDRVLDMLAV